MPALEDEGVHDVAHRRAAGVLERVPQIGGDRVAVGVRLEVRAHAVAEHIGSDVLLEHAQDAAALLVGQEVEHPLRLLGRADGVLDRAGRVHAVDGERRLARGGEADPAVPRRPEGVDAERLHEGGEGLVEPDALPPAHRDEVAEPHVGQLVRDHVGHALELRPGRLVLVDEERRVAEGDAAQVLHGAGGEVRDGDEVHLLARVGDVEVVGEEAQRERADLEGELGQGLLPGRADHAEGHTVDVDGLGRLELADDEGHQVGRHLHRGGEADAALRPDLVGSDDGRIGNGVDVGVHDEGDLEHRLAVRLVEAGEAPPGVHGLELGGRDGLRLAVGAGVGGAVEPAQLVVEGAGEAAADGARPGWQLRRRAEYHLLELVVEVHGAGDRGPVGGADLDVAHRELGGVQDDLVDGLRGRPHRSKRVPEKVADATSGSISMWYVSGSIVRGRRNASDPGALAELGAGGIR